MADQDQNSQGAPAFNMQRVYLKDLSVEMPNAPHIFLEQEAPQVEVGINVGGQRLAETVFESTVTATVTTRVNDKVLYLVEATQAGIFELANIPAEQMDPLLGIVCPTMLYPYLRASVADAIHAHLAAGAAPGRGELPGPVRAAPDRAGPGTRRQRRRRLRHHPAAGRHAPVRRDEAPTHMLATAALALRVAVLGAGSWGTALAGRGRAPPSRCCWARHGALAAAMARDRENARYLPDAPLPASLRFSADADEALAFLQGDADRSLVILGVPVAGLDATCRDLA